MFVNYSRISPSREKALTLTTMAVISGTEVLDAPLDFPRAEGEDRTNLIINYLPQAMTDMELYNIFSECGSIVSAKIMRDKSSGYSFGYGFVQYEAPGSASVAIENLNGMQVAPNKRIKVRIKLKFDRPEKTLPGFLQSTQHSGY